MPHFSMSKSIRSAVPRHPYETIKNDILGKSYTLTLNFIGTQKAQQLNKTYRKKTYSPNVLAFPLDKHTGEVFITPVVAKKEAKKFSMTPNGYIGYLFIHACLHLKGHDHGATMEKAENRYCQKYRLR